MQLPIDLVLVRHGQSVANAANRRYESADDLTEFTPEFCGNFAEWGLTDEGYEQIGHVRDWLRKEFPDGFDRHVTSWYTRAVETAFICHPGKWSLHGSLVERHWGPLEGLPHPLRLARYARIMAMLAENPLRTDVPEVESYPAVCARVERELNDPTPCERKIIVTHQEVMLAARLVIEKLSPQEFRSVCFPLNPDHKIKNGQVIHYSRRDPYTGELSPSYQWMRMARPAEAAGPIIPWTPIEQYLREPAQQSA